MLTRCFFSPCATARAQSLPPHLGGNDTNGGYGGRGEDREATWSEWVAPPMEAVGGLFAAARGAAARLHRDVVDFFGDDDERAGGAPPAAADKAVAPQADWVCGDSQTLRF